MSERFLLDSDICIYLLKDLSPRLSTRVRDQLEGALLVSAITFAEVGLGARHRPQEEVALAGLIGDVTLVPFDRDAAMRYADSAWPQPASG